MSARVHKLARTYSFRGWLGPLCETGAWRGLHYTVDCSRRWSAVTCKRCLAARAKRKAAKEV
jgi:hypothetical protein